MIDRIIKFSIQNKLIVGLFVLVLIGWGSYSLTHLPMDALPDITNNQVQVITVAPTLASQEVEQYVTAPIEAACTSLPNMIELRSISRLGLSVITIVFKDEVDIYLARQMVNERLKIAEEHIPKGVGSPDLAPASTGLSDIYQYVLHTKEGYDSVYTDMQLRTFQDWIVKRQLLGIEGIAEINTLGGHVKQYEIAINAQKLKAMNVTITELFEALENNNESTGGSYIEKGTNSYFIRGMGMVENLDDIEKIVVKESNGVPVLVRNIAKVQYGSATRYGAATRDGEGEVVVGVVMMLKGQNSAEVTKLVKEKMIAIQKSLPEGVVIEPFLDRSHLVDRAINTVAKNLIEGGLIVIFILVLLLGNFRAGLVVASVIPLSLLFAIGLMKTFGVSGNLMSLGAIDFGIIVDGAVIIVESIVHRISLSKKKLLTQSEMNEEVYEASSRIRTSAAFGEIIILIVYLPILTLAGIEGKMFGPMAQTVSFAILGAFILSLTYVPMMSSVLLSKKTVHKRNISDKLMDFFQRAYNPLIHFALRRKMTVIFSSLTLLIISFFLFFRMGGEFIPTLEEGDLALNTRIMAGSSLSQNITILSKLELMLKAKFPEVKEVVSRIGSSEIPTDPMSVEVADVIIVLKEKEEWTSAKTRDELSDKIKDELSNLPGVSMEISQPIQLRFNELMTGVRSDVAIKIFGDNLDTLAQKASEAIRLIENIPGIADLKAEQVTGLPQINVKYNRERIAQYGLSIYQINRVLRTAFAGEVAGVVFEGEKRFDMVVRLEKELRTNITDIRNLTVPLANGTQIPLYQVAEIEFSTAPMQISRDDGKRRIVLGLNVRNRDVQSVVQEIQKKLDKELYLPVGYYTTYGGQFENLIEANRRLAFALPLALFLILVLLYFTFSSLRQTLLIFTAVPLSAIGGVFALWLRDMPFSISAGVGFIALFGVAVLNGIVLIGYFNQLKNEGMTDINERVLTGTKVRLRPVLMTAAVASLGFLPMAISGSAGAEVQRPLATVVIGGLISATLLTLVVLPILYILFSGEKKIKSRKVSLPVILFGTCVIFMPTQDSFSQSVREITVDNAIEEALKNNQSIVASTYEIDKQKRLRKSAIDIEKTEVLLTQDPNSGGSMDNSLGILQKFSFPSSYVNKSNLAKANIKSSEQQLKLTQLQLTAQVKSVYYQLYAAQQKVALLISQDSLYTNFKRSAELRFKTGETNFLEKTTAETELMQLKNLKMQAESDVRIYKNKLKTLLNTKDDLAISDSENIKREISSLIDTSAIEQNPLLSYLKAQSEINKYATKVERSKLMPDILLGYYHQYLVERYNPNDISRVYNGKSRVAGLQFGITVPLWFSAQRGVIQASKLNEKIADINYQYYKTNLQSEYFELAEQYQTYLLNVNYFEQSGLAQADLILNNAALAFRSGNIGYVEFVQNINRASDIRRDYINTIINYNETVIRIESIFGGNK